MLSTSYNFKATKELCIKSTHFTGSQALHMYLEYSHPKLNHDIETLNNDGINSYQIKGNSITI